MVSNYGTLVPISAKTGQNTETNDTAWQSHKPVVFLRKAGNIKQSDDKSAIQFLFSAYQDFNKSCLYLTSNVK